MNKLFAGMLAVLWLGACDDIEARVECVQICDRYAECFDSDYNVDRCSEECTDEYEKDESYLKKIDDCESCIDDKSCSESTFKCADECIGIVP